MEPKIFVETGALFARFFKRDKHFMCSNEIWKQIESSSSKLFTTGYVLAEFATLLARRTSYQYSAEILSLVYSKETFTIEFGNDLDHEKAKEFFKKYADQSIGFVDCISFATMKRLKIKQAFTFDKSHFEYAGFKVLPSDY